MNGCYASGASEMKLIFGAISETANLYGADHAVFFRGFSMMVENAKRRISRTLLVRLVGWVRVYKK